MLECVVNVSEGQRPDIVTALAGAAGTFLLDVHTDSDHHRSVLTLAGPEVEEAVRAVAVEAVARIDLRRHAGAHPRLGALDVVPFASLSFPSRFPSRFPSLGDGTLAEARRARDEFATWAGRRLELPCFLYGPERSLPEVRRRAFHSLAPDTGPATAHSTAGATAVGARPVLVAYNVWLSGGDVALARAIARDLRSPSVRALGLDVGRAQVSFNLVEPATVGPEEVFDAVATRATAAGDGVEGAELVGLIPVEVLRAIPPHRWPELDLDPSRTIEARLEQAGLRLPLPDA